MRKELNSQPPWAETKWIFATLAGLRFSVVPHQCWYHVRYHLDFRYQPFYVSVMKVSSANSRYFIVTLETNLCHIFAVWKWCTLYCKGCSTMTVTLSDGSPILTATHRLLAFVSIRTASLKINSSRFLPPPPSLPTIPHIFIKQFGHFMWLSPERDHLLLDTSRPKGVEGYIPELIYLSWLHKNSWI